MKPNKVVIVNFNRIKGQIVANFGASRQFFAWKLHHPEMTEFEAALYAAKQISSDFGNPLAAGWLNGSTVVVLY